MSKPNIGILAKLPPELAYLAEPAMRFGVHQFDGQVAAFLASAAPEEMGELARLAERARLGNHYARVNEWLDKYDMTKYEEAANLYFMFGLMDAADLKFA
jgi:hypothetical protein